MVFANMISQFQLVSKKNFLWGMVNLLVVLPLFLYACAMVLYISYKEKSLTRHYIEILLDPIIIVLILLIILNVITDYISYKQNKVFWLKKSLFLFNIAYMIFLIAKLKPDVSRMSDWIFFGLALSFLFYKVFSYYRYYQLYIQSEAIHT